MCVCFLFVDLNYPEMFANLFNPLQIIFNSDFNGGKDCDLCLFWIVTSIVLESIFYIHNHFCLRYKYIFALSLYFHLNGE